MEQASVVSVEATKSIKPVSERFLEVGSLRLAQRLTRMMYVVYSRHIKFRQPHVLSITSKTITDGHQNLARETCVLTCTTLTNGFSEQAA